MNFDDYYEGYLHYLGQVFRDDEESYSAALDDMETCDPDEWEHRESYRAYLTMHPVIEFYECETSGPQGICVKAGTFCDHVMVTHNNAY